jgi:hypothetical protein
MMQIPIESVIHCLPRPAKLRNASKACASLSAGLRGGTLDEAKPVVRAKLRGQIHMAVDQPRQDELILEVAAATVAGAWPPAEQPFVSRARAVSMLRKAEQQ